ncbi:exonuclease domain-containing protein [Phycicoccus flavus]|uniref:exonuclease domain-containing protein n=1 Tax=Phycicoccus flavus TaxID=2502783 RepID=UPI000FEB6E55|nr:exonuclease domain-containing protein [Phycicoccus flavus]NHA69418.1 DNA polymerase III subunit epsilon [Phycicoccus flavus]
MSPFRRNVAARRARALRTAAPGPLADLLRSPSPPRDTPVADLPLLAVDLETTGLDPRTDHVLSVGWVPVDGGRVVLGGAGGAVVRAAADVGQSATVHRLTDDVVAGGAALEAVLADLLAVLRGRVLLAHFARVETTFLGAACERLWGAGLPVEVVDTLDLERRAVSGAWGGEVETGALRLWAARERRGLPAYGAHEALTDALACAELYLAQVGEIGSRGARPATLGDVVAR